MVLIVRPVFQTPAGGVGFGAPFTPARELDYRCKTHRSNGSGRTSKVFKYDPNFTLPFFSQAHATKKNDLRSYHRPLSKRQTVAADRKKIPSVVKLSDNAKENIEELKCKSTRDERTSQSLVDPRAASECILEILRSRREDSETVDETSGANLREAVGDMRFTFFTPNCFSNCERNLELDDDVIYVLHDVTKEVNALEIQNLEPEPSALTPSTPDCFSNCERNLDIDDDVIYVLHDVIKEVSDPVNLEREPPSTLTACPRILTVNMMHQLMEEALPVNLKTARWDRIYALGRDGDDFDTMTHNCANFKNTIIVAVTTQGHILGGYAAAPWVKQEGYNMSRSFYGNGESFLFASHPAEEKQQDHPAEEQQQDQNVQDTQKLETQATSEPENKEKKLHIYKWSGGNTYSQVCDVDDGQLAMGGGGGFGLLIQDNFSHGTTGRCSTFGNPPLVPRGIFEIVDFEVYGFTSLGATQGDPPNEHQALLDQDMY